MCLFILFITSFSQVFWRGWGKREVGPWFCEGLVWFEGVYYFESLPGVWHFVVRDRVVENIYETVYRGRL